MASAKVPIPASLDATPTMRQTDPRGTRIEVSRDGLRIGWAAKRKGAFSPKKPRNKKGW